MVPIKELNILTIHFKLPKRGGKPLYIYRGQIKCLVTKCP